MKLSDNTKRAIKNYGEQKCRDAYRLMNKGNGSIAVGQTLDLTGRQVIAATAAGHELAERDKAQQTAVAAPEQAEIVGLTEGSAPAIETPVEAPIEPEALLAGDTATSVPWPFPTSADESALPPVVAYVSMTDNFMSGWGGAEGKTSKFVIGCISTDQARIVANNARMRDEMRDIYISYNENNPPEFDGNKYHVTIRHIYQLGSRWTENK